MRTDILEQAKAIRASMDAAAIVLTDEQAAKAPRLYPTQAPGADGQGRGQALLSRHRPALQGGQRPHHTGRLDTGFCTGFVYRHRRGSRRDAGRPHPGSAWHGIRLWPVLLRQRGRKAVLMPAHRRGGVRHSCAAVSAA